MKSIVSGDPETKSADVVAANTRQLKNLFPEAWKEGRVDFEVLRQLLGDLVDEREEKYGLNWHGKRRARQLALTPSTGTLRPCPADSVDWDSTQNLMIEGDNLEVLKLLQKSYAGKVKLIYIDPPYNTGKDFVYPDNFQDNIKNYLELTGQTGEGGKKLSSNTEASGRFHTDWLNMMYPRLKLARNLMDSDAVLLVSIDNNEFHNLRSICNEVYGEENFLGTITWIRRTKPINSGDAKYQLQQNVEYVLVYCRGRNRPNTYAFTLPISSQRTYDYEGKYGKCRIKDIEDSDVGSKQRDTMKFPILGVRPGPGKRWKLGAEAAERLIEQDRIRVVDGKVRVEIYPSDEEPFVYQPFWSHLDGDSVGTAEDGKSELNELLDTKIGFDTVKPRGLIQHILRFLPKDLLVLDFFAGTGTTGHAVISQNAIDGGSRRYIVVQLPEVLDPEDAEQEAAANFCSQIGRPQNIAEITKERLLRAGKELKENRLGSLGDVGYRVLKLASSNIRAWEPDRENLPISVFESVDHLKADRTESDILYELLLKLGLDLCVPIEKKTIMGKDVHAVGGGVLLVCLATSVSQAEVEPLALGIVDWHKSLSPAGETSCVFRDSAFADDVAKTNLTAILQQHGLETVRSI